MEILRGEEDSFYIEIINDRNSILKNLRLNLVGFPSQRISYSPAEISRVNQYKRDSFKVKIKAPPYEGYTEYLINGTITGDITYQDAAQGKYTEKQYIMLIIQEVSKEDAQGILREAEKSIEEMRASNFNTNNEESKLDTAKEKLDGRRNKEAYDLGIEIIDAKEKSLIADNLIRRLLLALNNPRKSNLIIGNTIKKIDENYERIPLSELISGETVFSSEEIEETLNLAIVAFERGDYEAAFERAESAQLLLLLERKNSPELFMYLYWHIVLLFFIFLIVFGFLGNRTYKKVNISSQIQGTNEKEDSIRKLMIKNQRNYYSGKISSTEFHRIEALHNKKIAILRKKRTRLRNKRVKILAPQKVLQDLETEKTQIQFKVKKLQTEFYKKKKITENEYKLQFKAFNERLAEIEDERTTIYLFKRKKLEKSQKPKIKKIRKHKTKIKRKK